MKSQNSHVAIEPIKPIHTSRGAVKGIDYTDRTIMSCVSSKVIFDSEKYRIGDIIWVRTDALATPPFRNKLEIDGVQFCLIPEEFVVLVKSGSIKPTPTPSGGIPVNRSGD
jgi:hypothetical protein